MGPIRLITVIFGAVTLLAWECRAQSLEAELRVAFIFNFAKFVEWPQTPFRVSSEAGRFRICSTDAGISRELTKVKDREIAGERLEVVLLDASNLVSESTQCKLLYLDSVTALRTPGVLDRLEQYGLLIVGESRGLGLINFEPNGKRLGFTIDQTRVKRSGLRLSSKLQRLSVKVE